ncbi:MAG: hypothetical protein RIS20_732 [Bacteroidota bacterium]
MRKILHYLFLFLIFNIESSHSCSMYKLTLHGKTYVGCNEDAWRTTSRIWFETKGKGAYGAAFTGSRFDGSHGFAPQSGMNEAGLSFSRLASFTPGRKAIGGLKPIINQTEFLKQILHSCQTVEEVQAFVRQFDRSTFIEDVFIFTDKSGKYLVVEPYSTQIGNKSAYVLSNFCPSITSPKEAMKLNRYRKGVELLKLKQDTTLLFLRSLSDSMHVCRPKIGDGTLLTSIWNLNDGKVHLYFYHNYRRNKTFDLRQELKKGDHLLSIDSLFLKNAEFEKLGTYITTINSPWLMWMMMVFSGVLFCTSIYFLMSFMRKKDQYYFVKVLLAILGFALSYYGFILCTHQSIFYFQAPYEDRFSKFVSLAAYVPNILLLLILPLYYGNYLVIKGKFWTLISRNLFLLNNMIYTILVYFFFYWRLFWC